MTELQEEGDLLCKSHALPKDRNLTLRVEIRMWSGGDGIRIKNEINIVLNNKIYIVNYEH